MQKRKLTHSFAAKTAAVILLFFAAVGIMLSVYGAAAAASYNMYNPEYKQFSDIGIGQYYTESYSAFLEFIFNFRIHIIIAAVLFSVIALILYIFILCSAGKRQFKTEPVPNAIDRCPFDIILFALGFSAYMYGTFSYRFYYLNYYESVIFAIIFLIGAYSLFILLSMTFATRIKCRTLIKNTVIFRVLSFLWKYIKRLFGAAASLISGMPLVPKISVIVCAAGIVDFSLAITAMSTRSGVTFTILMILRLLFCAAVIYQAVMTAKIKSATKKIIGGNLSGTVETRGFSGSYKEIANDINNIRSAMNTAVDERMKSEHLKTELITNVSHDIKTPLTSIINYIDLLKKAGIDSEEAAGYIEILGNQSARLKKLTEDVVEASKASSGSIEVNVEKTSLGVLIEQVAGEYSEKLANSGVSLVLNLPDEDIMIYTDGRLMWRVFDNLMSNICKYSAPASRAYIQIYESNDGKTAEVVFRNISRDELNISPDELTERFVRGDSSRRTEGSGLGLSIAKSLTELCGGKFRIEIDGDLFKTVITFMRPSDTHGGIPEAAAIIPDSNGERLNETNA